MDKDMIEQKIAEGKESLTKYDGLELTLVEDEKDNAVGGFNLTRKKKKDDGVKPPFTF